MTQLEQDSILYTQSNNSRPWMHHSKPLLHLRLASKYLWHAYWALRKVLLQDLIAIQWIESRNNNVIGLPSTVTVTLRTQEGGVEITPFEVCEGELLGI